MIAKMLWAVPVLLASGLAHSQAMLNYENSELNYRNSGSNYENSSQSYSNSPQNYNNSERNYNSDNGVYDQRGNRTGYTTTSPSGTTNFFDNDGRRRGYKP